MAFVVVVPSKYLAAQTERLELQTLPYTEQDLRIFQAAKKTFASIDYWFGWRGYATFALVAFVSVLTLAPLFEKEEGSTKVIATGSMGFLAGITASWLGLYVTGSLPDRKSDNANRVQIVLTRLQKTYSCIAQHLLIDYFTESKREGALAIATAIDIPQLCEQLRSQVPAGIDRIDEADYFGELLENVHYIKASPGEQRGWHWHNSFGRLLSARPLA